MLARLGVGFLRLLPLLVPLVLIAAYNVNLFLLVLVGLSAPAVAAAKLAEDLYIEYVSPSYSGATDLGAVVYFSVLALQLAVLAWWLGGARGRWSLLKRSMVAAGALYLPPAVLLLLLILEAAAGLGGPGW